MGRGPRPGPTPGVAARPTPMDRARRRPAATAIPRRTRKGRGRRASPILTAAAPRIPTAKARVGTAPPAARTTPAPTTAGATIRTIRPPPSTTTAAQGAITAAAGRRRARRRRARQWAWPPARQSARPAPSMRWGRPTRRCLPAATHPVARAFTTSAAVRGSSRSMAPTASTTRSCRRLSLE